MVAGGTEELPEALAMLLDSEAEVIAADGGWRLCQTLGLHATLVIGDMDTLSQAEVEEAGRLGSEIRRFPADKSQSDLELAIEAAQSKGAAEITFLGALGGQWDHCLANLLAPLSLCQSLGIWARLLTGTAEIYLLEPGRYRLEGQIGSRASLAALSPEVGGLDLEGFRYPLRQASLQRRQTLGLANAVLTDQARLKLASGELLLTLIRDPSQPAPMG